MVAGSNACQLNKRAVGTRRIERGVACLNLLRSVKISCAQSMELIVSWAGLQAWHPSTLLGSQRRGKGSGQRWGTHSRLHANVHSHDEDSPFGELPNGVEGRKLLQDREQRRERRRANVSSAGATQSPLSGARGPRVGGLTGKPAFLLSQGNDRDTEVVQVPAC